jgi:hypothetical protein
MFRLLTNNLKFQSKHFRSFYTSASKTQVVKASAGGIPSPKVQDRLSFLKSEEEMRSYFNIVDWDKKYAEESVFKKLQEEKDKHSEKKRVYQTFTREELYKIARRFKEKLSSEDKVKNQELLSKKEALKNFELINEFSRDTVEYLKDQPKNCILISGFENTEDVNSVLNLLKNHGEVVQHEVIQDLMGRDALIRTYFYTDEEALTAKLKLHNYVFKQGYTLRVFNHHDAKRETVGDKTLVVSGLNESMKQQEMLEAMSSYGHVVKLEMPIISTLNKKSEYKINYFNTCDKFFQELENDLSSSSINDQIVMKNKLSFYSAQIQNLIKDFKSKLNNDIHSGKVSSLDSVNYFNNLLVHIKFFMKKFFPNEAINSLIIPELHNSPLGLNTINDNFNTKSTEAFGKILSNLENFLSKYEERMERLSRPLTKDEVPIDLYEIEENNKKGSKSSDPERLDKSLIFLAEGEGNLTEIKNEFAKINFYASFLPLEEQVAKMNFIRMLSEEEKRLVKDKFDLNLSVNTPKFLDYFINFSRAVGLKIVDRYIELSELYMSMTPLEKMYHGRKLAKTIKHMHTVPAKGTDEQLARTEIMDFLGIRKLKTIKDVYHLNSVKRMFDEHPYTRHLDMEEDVLLTDFYNMQKKGTAANISLIEFISMFNRHGMWGQKISYMQALVPMNLAKKRLYIERIRARMVKYNEIFLEFLKNYKLLSADDELRQKYDPEVNKLAELIFGKHDALNDVNMELLNEEKDDSKGFDIPDKHRMDLYLEGEAGGPEGEKKDSKDTKDTKKPSQSQSQSQSAKKDEKKFSRSEYKYSGKPLTENQIINRLDYVKSIRDKIINSILRISNLKHYSSKKYTKLNDVVHNKLRENIDAMFKDNPKLHAHYLEKIDKKVNGLKYVTMDFNEKQYKLEEIVEDIVQKEIDYVRKAQVARKYVNNIEELIDDKINKGNLVKALSVYESLFQIHEKYTDYAYMKSRNRAYKGSPIFVFFNQVKKIFEEEMQKVEIVKKQKLEEIQRGENKSLDEIFHKRKELIENYTNSLVGFQEAVKLNESAYEELQNYKLKKLGNINENILLDEEDRESPFYKTFINELKKKEYEIKQNKLKLGEEYEEEYKDVTSLISNLNKLQKEGDDNSTSSTYEKIFAALNKKKPVNKGYAFVTFATSDEAKKLYLIGQTGVKLNKKNVKVEPKFELTHENFDEDFMMKRANIDGNILNKREEVLQAEKKLKDFEENFYKNLSQNEKLNEYSTVREAFKDLYSDPFKKHDRNNPMSPEEEEEAKYRMKLNGEDNSWLFEDENLEKMRISRDKRILKKYTEGQMIKKGLLNEEFIDNEDQISHTQFNKTSSVVYDPKYELVKPITDSYFNSSNDYESLNKNTKSLSGRKLTPLSSNEFIENYLGFDYLNSTVPAFQSDKREASVYNELKELRERFPKEKFTKDPQETENLINEVNGKFIRLLKMEDSEKPLENANEELLDKITNISPLGKQLQTIINARNERVEDEETRQLITLQHFYEKRIEKHHFKETLITSIPEDKIDLIANNQVVYTASQQKDLYRTVEVDPPLVDVERKPKEGEEEEAKEIKKFQPGDTSFEAFLHRRRQQMEGEEAAAEATDEKNKTQFDFNHLTKEQVERVKEESMKEVLENIKSKYDTTLGVFDQLKKKENNINTFSKVNLGKENLYDYLEKKNNTNEGREIDTLKKIKVEKLKAKFLEELEKNFEEELHTLPSFKQYFLNLKYGNNHIQVDDNTNKSSLFDQSSKLNFDKRREELALLKNGKITPEIFKKTFAKNQQENEERLKKWITEKDEKDYIQETFTKMGIDSNDKETIEMLKVQNPHLFDNQKALEYIQEQNEIEKTLEEIQSLEEKDENEYYFNPNAGETLEEHLAGLSKTKYTKVILKKDEQNRIIIRREYKNNYKYDLDELMNFDLVKEREKMLKKIENFNFKSELTGNIDYYVNLYSLISQNKNAHNNFLNLSSEEFSAKINKIITKVEDYIRISYNMENFYFDDFKRLIDNLLTLSPRSLTNFVQSVTKLIRLVRSESATEEISDCLKSISEFSKDIFNEREVRIFVELMKSVLVSLGERNISDLDNFSKFIFIQNVLLKDILSNLSSYLSQEEMVYVYGMLKLLPTNTQLSSSDESLNKRFKIVLWNKYKQHMLKEFSIVLKKEKEIKPDLSLESSLEQKEILSALSQVDLNREADVDREIEEFSNKLKEYYIELSKASKKKKFN